MTDEPNLLRAQGGFVDVFDDGVYRCAACKTALYDADFKFESGCGWPCFFTCLPDAVRERMDADGQRMELICNACSGHVGHIFRNEAWGNPQPDERHCVNSSSLIFEPSAEPRWVVPDAEPEPE